MLAAHEDVDGIDLAGVDESVRRRTGRRRAGSIKRVLRPRRARIRELATAARASSRRRPCGTRSVSSDESLRTRRARRRRTARSERRRRLRRGGRARLGLERGRRRPRRARQRRRDLDAEWLRRADASPGTAVRSSPLAVAGRHVASSPGACISTRVTDAHEVVHPVRTVIAAGATTVVLTNAAGGLDPSVAPGNGWWSSAITEPHRVPLPWRGRRRPRATGRASSTSPTSTAGASATPCRCGRAGAHRRRLPRACADRTTRHPPRS